MRYLCWILVLLPTLGRAAETIELAPPGYELPYGERAQFDFEPVGDYGSVHLVLEVRMDSPTVSGSTHALALEVNAQPLQGALSRTRTRLLNKPLNATMASGLEIPWVRGHEWRVVYAPDFEIVNSEAAGSNRILEHSAYRLVLDITDLVTRGEQNSITLDHRGATLGLKRFFPETNPSLDLVFATLRIELTDDPAASDELPGGEVFSAERLMWQPPAAANPAEAVAVQPDGGLTVALPGLDLQLVSRFSWPGGYYNSFGADPEATAQEGWRVEATPDKVTGTGPDYRVERALLRDGHRLQVRDTITNLSGADLGLRYDNCLRAAPEQLEEVYLGGNPDPAVSVVRGMENMSVFVRGAESGCGLLAEDDVYRVQGVIYYDQGGGIRSDTLCLPAGGAVTLEWSLYPVLRSDYYDFINLARRDLDVNFTVPGGFQFGLPGTTAMGDEQLENLVDEGGVKFISSGVWFDRGNDPICYHGEHMLEATRLRELLGQAVDKLNEVTPEVQSLIYIHCFINTDPQGPEKHADSRVIYPVGEHYINQGYTRSIGIPFYYYYPSGENSYLDAMNRVVDMCLDDDKIGADGIYWDEVEMMSTRVSYDAWDGISAELTEDHKIARKFGYVQLLSREGKVALTEYIRQKGGSLIGNSAPITRTMANLKFPRFVETASLWYPARAHLYTPLSLGDHHTVKTYDDLLRDIRNKLMWGSLYYYYSRPAHPHPTITQRMFPFTPVELHRGWLLGEERILTAVPGTFTFGDEKAVKVYWYGADGALTEAGGDERVEAGRRLIRLDLAEGEMAVIERAGG